MDNENSFTYFSEGNQVIYPKLIFLFNQHLMTKDYLFDKI